MKKFRPITEEELFFFSERLFSKIQKSSRKSGSICGKCHTFHLRANGIKIDDIDFGAIVDNLNKEHGGSYSFSESDRYRGVIIYEAKD